MPKSAYVTAADIIGAGSKRKQDKKLGLTTSHQGGEAYRVPDEGLIRLTRFLILGSATGSFYQTPSDLTKENVDAVKAELDRNPLAVDEIIRVSNEGLNIRQDPVLFALALATRSKNDETRQRGYLAVLSVCRTLSQLSTFVSYRLALGGYADGAFVGKKIKNAKDKDGNPIVERYGGVRPSSAGLRRAIQKWIDGKTADDLAYQLIKYPERSGVGFDDMIRFARPKANRPGHEALFRYAVKGEIPEAELDQPIIDRLNAVAGAKDAACDARTAARLIRRHKLPREAVRTDLLNERLVWEALLEDMPMTAMVRNLGNMSKHGVLDDSDNRKHVIEALTSQNAIRKSRLHPVNLFTALQVYASGSGVRGSGSWKVRLDIIDALSEAFDLSFVNVEPSGKNILIAIDTSGSMRSQATDSMTVSCAGLSAVMALVLLRSEPNARVIGVDTQIQQIPLSAKQRPDDVIRMIAQYGGGGTYLHLPFAEVEPNDDAIVLFTDSENGGPSLRAEQLKFIHDRSDRRMVLCQMLANRYSWAANRTWDQVAKQSLEIAGFDPGIGKLTSDFIAGRF